MNLFHIHGQDYGVYQDGGISFSRNADQVRLCDFKFRNNERFIYEYDLGDCWQYEVRVEARWVPEDKRAYPSCIGGRRRAPSEDCGGHLAFMARRDEGPLQVTDFFEEIRCHLETRADEIGGLDKVAGRANWWQDFVNAGVKMYQMAR